MPLPVNIQAHRCCLTGKERDGVFFERPKYLKCGVPKVWSA